MRTEDVPLRHLRGGAPAVVALPEPCGRDEIAVDGVDTRSAVALVDRLLAGCGSAEPAASLKAVELAASDRDALLAALHRQCWGDRIVATLTCVACAGRFDLSFELSAVQRHLAANDSPWRANGTGQVESADGTAFTVPTAEEEMDASVHGVREAVARLAAKCGVGPADIEAASAALESGAPILDLELAARCADCGHEQSALFDLQSFVLQRLLSERETLLSEVHLLAAGYGWSLGDILSLPRSTRRSLTVLVSEARTRAAARRPRGWR